MPVSLNPQGVLYFAWGSHCCCFAFGGLMCLPRMLSKRSQWGICSKKIMLVSSDLGLLLLRGVFAIPILEKRFDTRSQSAQLANLSQESQASPWCPGFKVALQHSRCHWRTGWSPFQLILEITRKQMSQMKIGKKFQNHPGPARTQISWFNLEVPFLPYLGSIVPSEFFVAWAPGLKLIY